MGKKDLADEYDKRGISLNYDNLSEQVLPMLGNMEDVTPIDMGAEYINGDIIKQLEPHFWDRSAYRQPVVKRMIIIKQAEESGIQLPENKYIIPKEELKRPELLPPLLASVGTMMLITMFSQAKNKTRDIVTAMTKHKYLLGAAVAGAIVANSMLKSNAAEYGSMIGKTAAVTTTNAASVPQDLTGMQQAWKAMKWGGPALLVYGTGGHVINKVQRGEKINPVEKFVTQHPIISAVGATVAVNKPKLITDLTKRFYKMFKKAEEMGLEGFNIDDYPVEDRDAIAAYIWTKNKT
jgi:phosphoenolpyruvate synthase/pyruvate phosphate dikinase